MAEAGYPRDLHGYGRNPPDPRWPGNARIAVQFVVNFEEGGENNILHGDRASEAFLSDVLGAQPWPGQRHANIESMFEYGSRAGFWRLWRIFTQRKLPVTVFGVATALKRNPNIVAAMKEANWDIASHSLKWVEHKDMSQAEERVEIADAIRVHTEVTGQRPLGWYTGRTSINTVKLVMEAGGFLYSCDSYADDLPYWIKGPAGPHLIIPYSLDINDMRFVNAQGFGSGDQFFTYLKDSFDVLYAEGKTLPKMLSVGLHCRIVGRPGRAAALMRFLDSTSWVMNPGLGADAAADRAALACQSSRIWLPTLPSDVGIGQDTMSQKTLSDLNACSKDDFVGALANIFEYSPWIAGAGRVGAAVRRGETSCSEAMKAAVDHAMPELRLALIKAHPDLANKTQRAAGLTARNPAPSRTASASIGCRTPSL